MIVEEPPYDLVFVFADADAKALFDQVVERGQQYCVSSFRWRSIRDPLRDNLRTDPLGILHPFLAEQPKVLLLWDHHGSGAEHRDPAEVEAEVLATLMGAGVEEGDALACAFRPEVEAVLVPVWDRVRQLMAQKREQLPPPDTEILALAQRRFRRMGIPDSVGEALTSNPKEMFEALLGILNLRFSAAVFEEMGRELSIPTMKDDDTTNRVLLKLVEWFPPAAPLPGLSQAD